MRKIIGVAAIAVAVVAGLALPAAAWDEQDCLNWWNGLEVDGQTPEAPGETHPDCDWWTPPEGEEEPPPPEEPPSAPEAPPTPPTPPVPPAPPARPEGPPPAPPAPVVQVQRVPFTG